MKWKLLVFAMGMVFLVLPFVSGAHFIVGKVNDALDGTSANGYVVTLWNPDNGQSDNVTDVVGVDGNSNEDNTYMIDCELLSSPCKPGDFVNVKVFNNGSDYFTSVVSVRVTGSGFNTADNLTLNSPPLFTSITVDDDIGSPVGEIDLTAGGLREVRCEGVVFDYDGDSSLENVTAEFFDTGNSSFGSTDDNNNHYTNSSCVLNQSYGDGSESYFTCSFQVEYYANSGNWNCTTIAFDNMSVSGEGSNSSLVNTLLALNIPSTVDFGVVDGEKVSNESSINVTNAGNVMVNLSLAGYARSFGDNYSMNCSQGELKNISVDFMKYNLTDSNSGEINLSEFESNYANLTSSTRVKEFNLGFRRNDAASGVDDMNSTFWRVYVPAGAAGTCSGNIIFGAVQSPES